MTGARQIDTSPRPPLGTRTFTLLALGCLFITLYGSLVPFHYAPLSWEETFARWDEVCRKPLGMDSRTDFATNVLLFIPLSFLVMGALTVDRGRPAAIVAAIVVVPLCAALSASIEFTQLWFQERVSSLNDVLAETIGAAIGAATWVLAGQRITDHARSFRVACGPDNLAVKLLPVYLFLLVLVHVMPLDLTISPHELYHKWKEGRVVLVPFTTDYGGWVNAVTKNTLTIIYFVPLGLLLSLWGRPVFRSGWNVLAVGLGAAAGISFLKLFVLTRYCDTTDIVTGGLAVWCGWWAVQWWKKHGVTVPGQPPPWWTDLLRPALFVLWLAAAVVVNWYPFDVHTEEEVAAERLSPEEAEARAREWVVSYDGQLRTRDYSQRTTAWTLGPFIAFSDAAVVRQRWAETSLVPMADLFQGTEYHAFDQFVQKTLLFLPLGALLMPTPTDRRFGWWRALLAGLLLSCLFEAGKLLVPGRFCSTSNVLIETNAALCGFLLWRRLLALLAGRPAAPFPVIRSDEWVQKPVGLGVFITKD
jgi:VanZ family protein